MALKMHLLLVKSAKMITANREDGDDKDENMCYVIM